MSFRNGEVAKGGDARVWAAIDGADYDLLWRSVDAFGACPIEGHLSALFAHQETTRQRGDVEAWLATVDVASPEVAAITTKDGVRAKGLFDLFRSQTGSPVSITRFGLEIGRHAGGPESPFGPKVKTMHGTFYPLKAQTSSPA